MKHQSQISEVAWAAVRELKQGSQDYEIVLLALSQDVALLPM